MPRGNQNRNHLNKYWHILKSTELGVILGIATILITILYGAWGVILTKKNNFLNQQMLDLSKKQVDLSKKQIELSNTQIQLSKTQNETSLDLKHFTKLLGKTDTIVSLSNSELKLNQNEQKITNKNTEYANLSDEGKFYFATQNLELLLFQPNNHPSYLAKWDSTQKFTYLNNVDLILKSQLDNPYLLSNKYMFQEWLSVRDSIYRYAFNVNFYPAKKIEGYNFGGRSFEENQKNLLQQWRNCFIAIGNLEQNLSNYMLYYRFFRFDTTKRKQPSIESYKLLMEQRKRDK